MTDPAGWQTRIVHQFVVVRNHQALVSGAEWIPVPANWPDGTQPAWVAYEDHDGPVLGISGSRQDLVERLVDARYSA